VGARPLSGPLARLLALVIPAQPAPV